jgi:hypothetical protein
MNRETALALTKEPGNYFFGFHDTLPWNHEGDKMLALKIWDITTPPNPSVPCAFGFISDGHFIPIGETYAYNYPQGARQQWIGKSNYFSINDKVGDEWGSRIFDADSLRQVDSLNYPTHVMTDEGWAFGLDYSRLNRVGAYGYAGLRDKTTGENAPKHTGIVKHHIHTKDVSNLVTVKTVANHQMTENPGQHHYITHLSLNPSQNRIAFLHRFKLKDGGETTRLMTIGTSGEKLRCLATGFLSHFDWKDDGHIAIWGRMGTSIEKFRKSILYNLLPSDWVVTAKENIKKVLKPSNIFYTINALPSSSWSLLSDEDVPVRSPLAKGVIYEDGHPMFCPANRDWLICDTYPNAMGERELYLFQCSTQKKITLGVYRMIAAKPNPLKSGALLRDVERSVLKAISPDNLAFHRSGLHCDLHPRWKTDGSAISFDSIHEGRRLIYSCEVGQYLST